MINQYPEIKIIKTKIFAGLSFPVKVLHITDTHIALDDPGKDSGRAYEFEGNAEGLCDWYLSCALKYAKENKIPVIHTGDLIDFLSERNFKYIENKLKGVDYLYAAGNHDFCHCVGEAKEDHEYKMIQMKRIAPYFSSNMIFDSKIINGVNFVTMDDSYYLISEGQTEMLYAEVAKGLPIILCMHVPIFTSNHADIVMAEGNHCGFLICPEEEYLEKYSADRREQQMPDDSTMKAVEYIKNEPLIKAVIAGHTHRNIEEQLTSGKIQVTTHGTFAGYAREITIE